MGNHLRCEALLGHAQLVELASRHSQNRCCLLEAALGRLGGGEALQRVRELVVEDVAASWEQYQRFPDALAGPAPAGLIVHAAGPTDEGFRIVAVWESEQAWRQFAERVGSADGSRTPYEVFRALHPAHVVYGGREEE